MLAPGKHYIGDVIRLAVNYSTAGTDVDPDGVTLSVMHPDGVVVSYIYGTMPRSAIPIPEIIIATT